MSRLKAVRLAANMSQSQLAEKSSVCLITIQRYEQGQRDISKASYHILSALADALRCKPDDLIGD